MDDFINHFGQGLGIIAIILGVISYQVKTQNKLLFLQTITAFVFIVHYFMIDAISGMALNIVGLSKNAFYWYKSDKGGAGRVMPIIFASVTFFLGIFTAIQTKTWYSVFLIIGLTVHVLCFAIPDAQKVRKSILFTSPMVLIYNIFAFSIPGMVYESMATVSAAIGILRYHNLNKKSERTK